MSQHKTGVFIPSWAFTVIVSTFLFLSGAAAAYYHFQGEVQARIAVIETKMQTVDRKLDQLESRAEKRTEDLQDLKFSIEEIKRAVAK